MGNAVVLLFVAFLIVLIIRALRKEHKESGSCAFCSYAKAGKCDHVGHEELDHQDFHLTGIAEIERKHSSFLKIWVQY